MSSLVPSPAPSCAAPSAEHVRGVLGERAAQDAGFFDMAGTLVDRLNDAMPQVTPVLD